MTALSDAHILATVRATMPEASAIYIFGSRAQGEERPDSDLDLAVLLDGRADPVRLWEAQETIARLLGIDVDLVDLGSASTVLQYQVITGGRLLSEADAKTVRFEIFVLAEKLDLDLAISPRAEDFLTFSLTDLHGENP